MPLTTISLWVMFLSVCQCRLLLITVPISPGDFIFVDLNGLNDQITIRKNLNGELCSIGRENPFWLIYT
jgi:hypothetical protein